MKEILARARQLIQKPQETWPVVRGEASTVQDLFINYAAPLALVPSVAALIGLTLIGLRMPAGHIARAPFLEALTGGVLSYALHLAGILAGAWAVSLLAPYFNSRQDLNAAVKLVVYSLTPAWLVGIFSLLPGLGILQLFGLYGIYLFYLGLPVLLDTPKEKALWYTAVAVMAAFLISLFISVLVGGAVYGPMFLRMMVA